MTRETSIEAYNTIKNSDLLSKRRFEVYEALFNFGPCTTNELFKRMVTPETVNNPCIHARLNELQKIGCVREIGEKQCAVTGMTVIEWDVTSQLPVKKEKTLTAAQKLTFLKACIGQALATLRENGLDNKAEELKAKISMALGDSE